MAFIINCPQCQQQYQLGEQLLGKAIRCKNCNAAFRLPAQVPASAAAAAGQPNPAQPVAQPAGAANDPLFKAAGAPAAHDPLGNHIVVDPGFADVDPSQFVKKSDEPADPLFTNQAVLDSQSVQEALRQSQEPEYWDSESVSFWRTHTPWVFLIGAVVLAIVSIIAFSMDDGAPIIIGCMIGFGIVANIYEFVFLAKINQRTPDEFMSYLFVPFYQFHYIAKYWHFSKHKVLVQVALTILMLIGGLILFLCIRSQDGG